jgi:hypothetical protein
MINNCDFNTKCKVEGALLLGGLQIKKELEKSEINQIAKDICEYFEDSQYYESVAAYFHDKLWEQYDEYEKIEYRGHVPRLVVNNKEKKNG